VLLQTEKLKKVTKDMRHERPYFAGGMRGLGARIDEDDCHAFGYEFRFWIGTTSTITSP
jgi:hypothetical protein